MSKVARQFALWVFHGVAFCLLTLLTQLGGLAWLISLPFRHRLLVFVFAYAGLSVAALYIAPVFDRVPLPCLGDQPLRVQSPLYCVLNRQYVTPKLHEVAMSVAEQMQADFPGTVTLALDANFPFLEGFPLLPHLSHNDGRKLDLAYYYEDAGGYLSGVTRSFIGYFAFEQGETSCPSAFPTLRWDLEWLQPWMRDLELNPARTKHLLELLVEKTDTTKVFIEPHLKVTLGLSSAKLRFQGCRAARHDDHIHFEVAQ